MATATFGKKFSVSKKCASAFVKEMSKKATPTLSNDFKSNYTTLSSNQQLKNQLLKVLGK